MTAGKLPPALFGASMQQLRLRAARRAPFAFGWLRSPTVIPSSRWDQPTAFVRALSVFLSATVPPTAHAR